jgi:hypothetical protein
VGTEERTAERQAWIGLYSRLRTWQRFARVARVVVVLPIVYVLTLFLLWLLRCSTGDGSVRPMTNTTRIERPSPH